MCVCAVCVSVCCMSVVSDVSNVTTNETTLDNVTFKFSKVATTTLTGKTDVTDIKDKIMKFVDDYNTMITNLNKKVSFLRKKLGCEKIICTFASECERLPTN